MLTICHRGYHAAAHENTLEAFAQAAFIGAKGIETDVRLSADGLPVLLHDRVVGMISRRDIVRAIAHGEVDARHVDELSRA